VTPRLGSGGSPNNIKAHSDNSRHVHAMARQTVSSRVRMACSATKSGTPYGADELLHSGNRQALHHFNPITREDHEMRMAEE
jgi:hypothetical protein